MKTRKNAKIMRRLMALVLALMFLAPSAVMAKKNEEGYVPQYQMEGAGKTSQNGTQVNITIISKSKDKVTDADIEKAAVHGVLFRDYDDATNTGFGSVASHRAIMKSPTAEAEYADFFEPFFVNGDYKQYVQLVSDSRRVVKSGKEWKVSAIVRVNTTALKKMLRKQGMVKTLGDGW